MTDHHPALLLDELAKQYGERPALRPLSLSIDPGERVVLIGHNGSGKTTMMRMVAGLLDPSDGSAEVCGYEAGSLGARRRLCWLSDTPVFYDDLSVNEHLQFVAGMHAVTEWRERADELLAEFGLSARADDLPGTFSRGLRQKAAIVLAMIRPFEVLLVDEPFVGLDASGKQALLRLFDEIADRGACQVVATHELEFVQRADRLLALRDGELVFDGPPGDAAVHDLVLPG